MKTISAKSASSRKGANRRQKILEAAAGLIHRHGVNGTSVDDVLAASSSGKSQFYHYFGNKEGLVREVMAFHQERLWQSRHGLLNETSSLDGLIKWLKSIAEDFESGLFQDGCPLGNIAGELAASHADVRGRLAIHICRLGGSTGRCHCSVKGSKGLS